MYKGDVVDNFQGRLMAHHPYFTAWVLVSGFRILHLHIIVSGVLLILVGRVLMLD